METEQGLDFDDAVQKIDKILFVINTGSTHWILIAMDIAQATWNIYDSLAEDMSLDGSGSYKGIVEVGLQHQKSCEIIFWSDPNFIIEIGIFCGCSPRIQQNITLWIMEDSVCFCP